MAGPAPAGQKPKLPASLIAHDWLNILSLPVIFLISILGLTGHLNPSHVTDVFIVYIVFDFLWIYFLPQCLPSKPGVILAHHVVTMGLLGFAWFNPEFAKYTCMDGLTEINTFFMVLRRQSSFARRTMHQLYWCTYIPLRLVMYPGLVPVFWQALKVHSLGARLLVCACQVFLCCFNFAVFWLSVRRRILGRLSLRPSPCDTPRAGAQPAKQEEMLDGQKLKQALRCQNVNGGANIYIRASSTGLSR